MSDNKLFKNLIKHKKQEYKKEIVGNMNIKKKDKKLFWKLLDKLEMRKKDVFKNYIPASKWNDH